MTNFENALQQADELKAYCKKNGLQVFISIAEVNGDDVDARYKTSTDTAELCIQMITNFLRWANGEISASTI